MAAFDQMTFHHHAKNVLIALADLVGSVVANFHLAAIVFAAVGMAEIDHEFLRQADCSEFSSGGANMFRAVIRLFTAA